tara:strand:- start:704 stop:2491 length:1788 start_codon:yes stop_codon:yes gene_type:complete
MATTTNIQVLLTADFSSLTREEQRARRSLESMNRALTEQTKANRTASHAQNTTARALSNIGVSSDIASTALVRHNTQLRNSNGNYKQANQGMRMMRGGTAQLGYQIQDVAVQLQMGQNALLIFGQQGSQVASIFGAKGAVLGAVFAVSAALATAFMPSVFDSGKALKELKARLEGAADSFDDLTEAQQRYLIEESSKKIEQINDELGDLTRKLNIANSAQNFLNNAAQASVKDQVNMAMAMQGAAMQAGNSAEQTALYQAQIDTLNQKLKEQADIQARIQGEVVRDDKAIQSLIDSLEKEADTLGYTETQLALYETASLAATGEDLSRVIAIRAVIDAYEGEQEAIEGAESSLKEYRDFKAEQAKALTYIDELYFQTERQMLLDSASERRDILLAALDQRHIDQEQYDAALLQSSAVYNNDLTKLKAKELGIYSDAAGSIAGLMKEGSSAQRAALAVQKGLTVASAVMNMHAAIGVANAAAPFPANIPGIAMALSQGLSAIAGVRGVSFEGGGFTGMGARSGGMDGKGGFAAMLHPNETVVDHTKGGVSAKSVNVNFQIVANDTAGFDELLYSRRGQIINMINQAVNNSGRRSIT